VILTSSGTAPLPSSKGIATVFSIGGATSVDGINLDGTELSRITALSLELQTGGDVAIDSVPQAASDAIDTLIVNATGSTAFTGASVFDALTVTSAAGITIDNDANATTPVAEIDADTGNIFFGDTVTFNTGTELGDGTVVLLTASNGGTIDFAGAGTAADQSTNAVNVRIEAGSLDISGGGQFDFGAQDLYLYTHNDTTAMNIGTGAAAAFHVSDGEIATLSGTGTVRFGEDAAQSGTITIETVAIPAGANNASAATYEFFSNAGAGTIILNDGSGASTAFATSGAGAVDFTAGTGSIYTPNASNLVAEISTTGTINLDSAGPDRRRLDHHPLATHQSSSPRAPTTSTSWGTGARRRLAGGHRRRHHDGIRSIHRADSSISAPPAPTTSSSPGTSTRLGAQSPFDVR
jgi:hypothetical protein